MKSQYFYKDSGFWILDLNLKPAKDSVSRLNTEDSVNSILYLNEITTARGLVTQLDQLGFSTEVWVDYALGKLIGDWTAISFKAIF